MELLTGRAKSDEVGHTINAFVIEPHKRVEIHRQKSPASRHAASASRLGDHLTFDTRAQVEPHAHIAIMPPNGMGTVPRLAAIDRKFKLVGNELAVGQREQCAILRHIAHNALDRFAIIEKNTAALQYVPAQMAPAFVSGVVHLKTFAKGQDFSR
jgi:hypothetical protein